MFKKIMTMTLCALIIALFFTTIELSACECVAPVCEAENLKCWQSTFGYTVQVFSPFPKISEGNKIYEYKITKGDGCDKKISYFEIPLDICTGFCAGGVPKPENIGVSCTECLEGWTWQVLYQGDSTGYLKGDTNHCIVKVSVISGQTYPITVKLTLTDPDGSVGKSLFSTFIKTTKSPSEYGSMLIPGCETTGLTQTTFPFLSPMGGQLCSYTLDPTGKKVESIQCEDSEGGSTPLEWYPVSAFVYCLPGSCPAGETGCVNFTFESEPYNCHRAVDVNDGANLLGNPGTCPRFIKPPGVWCDPCKR